MANSVTMRAMAVAALGLAAVHVTMTALYLSPANIVRRQTRPLWEPYMSTMFEQNWHLFSPEPALSSTKLAVRCHWRDGTDSEWIDPAAHVLAESYGPRRLLGYGKLLYVIREIPRALQHDMLAAHKACMADRAEGEVFAGDPAQDPCSFPVVAAEVTTRGAGAAARQFAVDVCDVVGSSESLASVDYKVVDFMPLKYSERGRYADEGLRWSRVSETPYPTIVVGDSTSSP